MVIHGVDVEHTLERLDALCAGIKEYRESLRYICKQNSEKLKQFRNGFLNRTRNDLNDAMYDETFLILGILYFEIQDEKDRLVSAVIIYDRGQCSKFRQRAEFIEKEIEDTNKMMTSIFWDNQPLLEKTRKLWEKQGRENEKKMMERFKAAKEMCLKNALILGEKDLREYIIAPDQDEDEENDIVKTVTDIQKNVMRKTEICALWLCDIFM